MKERKNVSAFGHQRERADEFESDSLARTCQRGGETFEALIAADRGSGALLIVLWAAEMTVRGNERRLSRSPWPETLTTMTLLRAGSSSQRTVLYLLFRLPDPYRNAPTHHEWVVIVLRIWTPRRGNEHVAMRVESRLALLRLVGYLGHDVREGRVRRHDAGSHRGRDRGVTGNMVREEGVKGGGSGCPNWVHRRTGSLIYLFWD